MGHNFHITEMKFGSQVPVELVRRKDTDIFSAKPFRVTIPDGKVWKYLNATHCEAPHFQISFIIEHETKSGKEYYILDKNYKSPNEKYSFNLSPLNTGLGGLGP